MLQRNPEECYAFAERFSQISDSINACEVCYVVEAKWYAFLRPQTLTLQSLCRLGG